jgi:hypothetical protein
MGQDNIEQHRRYVAISYVFMFLALFTMCLQRLHIVARKVAIVDNAEVWIHAHALWIMRNVLLFIMMAFLLPCGLFHCSFLHGIVHCG